MITTICTRKPTDFECVQDCPLPLGSVYAQVRAIEAYLAESSSATLDKYEVIQLLDQILDDRGDQADPSKPPPIPMIYYSIITFLRSKDYPMHWVKVCIRQIDRHKTAIGLESIEEIDQAPVQKLLDKILAAKGEAI